MMFCWALGAALLVTLLDRIRSRAVIRRLRYDRRTGALVDSEFHRLGRRRLRAGSVLVVLDVNGLKAINDTMGHAAGDRILTGVAEWVRCNVQPGVLFGRIGGDEFGLLADSRACLGPLQRQLRYPLFVGGRWVSVACGVVVAEPKVKLPDLIDRADREMYADKRIKKNTRQAA